ncbi:MAG TPA: 5'-methylthioadenosine/S-adenosylhomocysteine nucleosidase [Pilimelia sp.]|nr:5'-methylthioadenosine/S-adenosylhomocysteine nucleosidase [Pilimelia sp.]
MASDPAADVVFLAALGLEYDAIYAHLTNPRRHVDPDGTRYATGGLPGGCRVALALIGEGNLAAAALTGRAIQEFRPRALMLVGVAGGLNDEAAIGDVVVATRVHAYQGGRDESGGFRPRPKSWPAAHDVEQVARDVARAGEWATSLPGRGSGGEAADPPGEAADPGEAAGPPSRAGEATPQVHFKPIVSGDVVLDSRTSPVAGLIAQHYSDAIAIDMESAGVAEAAHRKGFHRTITIRAISDAADGAKRRADAAGHQPRAAAHAAAFAVAVAQKVGESTPDPGGPGSPAGGARASIVHRSPLARLGVPAMIRRGGWPAQVLSAVVVAIVMVLIYVGVTFAVRERSERGTTTPTGGTGVSAPARTASDVVLKDWLTIDFETGESAEFNLDVADNLPGMDLALSHGATRLYALAPARLAVLDTPGEHSLARCLAADNYRDSIQENLQRILTAGRDVCVRTQEEGLAMLTVVEPPSSAFPRLTFHYTLWKTR